jgi:hypothetical protein
MFFLLSGAVPLKTPVPFDTYQFWIVIYIVSGIHLIDDSVDISPEELTIPFGLVFHWIYFGNSLRVVGSNTFQFPFKICSVHLLYSMDKHSFYE